MGRVAIFVDAGYLFAQGSVALVGTKQPRSSLILNETAALAELYSIHTSKALNYELLRVYWYDGLSARGPTAEQARLAHTDNVKVRHGFINSMGQQKGVDSLIVTDLIDLARNHAMSDAILLSGDEDVRIGVQIAQSFGVRVHLIGIVPSRGSQSRNLLQEADTTTEWSRVTVTKFLTLRTTLPVAVAATTSTSSPATSAVVAEATPPATPVVTPGTPVVADIAAKLDPIANALAASLTATDLAGFTAYWKTQRGIPSDFDGKLIARGRATLSRDLSIDEKRHMRRVLAAAIRKMILTS